MEAQSSIDSHRLRSQHALRVLVVDDCRQLLEVVTEVLSAHGFEVLAASGASEALNMLAETRPDLIISDIMMPGLDGFHFSRQVRENPEWNGIPFVFLTALSDPEDVRRGKSMGCDDYLVKPFDPLDLVAIVRGKVAVAQRRQVQADERLERYRRRVIQTLSHEFRTPLVAINTGAELLLERRNDQGQEQFEKLLHAVHRGGLRLQRLVEDFMALQQIDSGAALSTAQRLRSCVSLADLAENAIEMFHDTAVDEPRAIELSVSGGKHLAEVCEAQVANCIQRLLTNAHKFSPPEAPIQMKVWTDGKQVNMSVRDRGPGLPAQVAQEACKSFTQIDRDKYEQQGCGLGLTIASYYARINGATIAFREPEDGVGLQVVLTFTGINQ